MKSAVWTSLVVALTVPLLLSSLSVLVPERSDSASLSAAPLPLSASSSPAASAPPSKGSAAAGAPSAGSANSLFDQRVQRTAAALTAAGIPRQEIRLPYVGTPARVVNGAVVPGYALGQGSAPAAGEGAPAPVGIAYYGENNTTGTVQTTTVSSSSIAGTLTVNQFNALYASADTPDMWGIQLNALLNDVTIGGVGGNQFWVQNAVDVFQSNDTLQLGEDTWNFTTASSSIPTGTTTILSHDSTGSVVGGVYVGEGPWIHTPLPFTLTLYLNSSLTPAGDQELWYNYTVVASGALPRSGNYDWVVFNSGGAANLPVAPFVASGGQTNAIGMPYDYELDFGIGAYNGETMDVLSANLSARLDYCPITIARCTASEFRTVPAATNFGSQTGETSSGLYVSYQGTTAAAAAGPFVLRGLWGYQGAAGSTVGTTAVYNRIAVSGSPDPGATAPYVFVFLSTASSFDTSFQWAPDVPVWHLAAGVYHYELMLSDYAEQVGNLTVGSSPVNLTATLPYHPASGVYTPLWALSNTELPGISSAGNGSLSRQYVLFNNPTSSCSACGGAATNNVSPVFSSWNDYLYPVFPGILLDTTTSYVTVASPVSFCSYWFQYGPLAGASSPTSVCFYLQIEFVSTEHVTLSHDAHVGGWPAMFETLTLAGLVDASQNVFPTASVVLWNSTHDLVMANDFVGTPSVPSYYQSVPGVAPAVRCFLCAPLDTLLLFGGTSNTVWGNTFRDPAEVSGGGALPQFAGLAEAESGDLLYNNNFSIDNPTVYLPFDIYTDACPMGYAGDCGPLVPPNYQDQWNVSPQSAGRTATVANGFPLVGSILGTSCSEQGGNYWNDYGNGLNPTSTLPFTNVYNYSEITALLPPASSPDQSSIRVGGDFAPLTRAGCGPGTTIRFHEVGLPTGASWSVDLSASVLPATTGRWINGTAYVGEVAFSVLGPQGFGVARVTGLARPSFDSVNVSGTTTLTVHFGALETVSFDEYVHGAWSGLPTGSRWAVTLTPVGAGSNPLVLSNGTSGSLVKFSLPHGAHYRFLVSRPSDYKAAPAKGHLGVPDGTLTKKVKFRPITEAVKFRETTLPTGTLWYVNLTGPMSVDLSGTTAALKARLVNGTYTYVAQAKGGPKVSGTFTVVAPGPVQVLSPPVAKAVPLVPSSASVSTISFSWGSFLLVPLVRLLG